MSKKMSELEAEVLYVPLKDIHPNDYNPNVMSSELFDALLDFVKMHNPEDLDPVWLRKDGPNSYEIIDEIMTEYLWNCRRLRGRRDLYEFDDFTLL